MSTVTDDDSVVPMSAQERRPLNTALRQQRVRAWYPILDPWWVICSFVILSAIFIPVGFKIQSLSDTVVEEIREYDAFDLEPDGECRIGDNAKASQKTGQTCTVTVPINKAIRPPILIHYQLENFYQNHRKYMRSRDDFQLAGQVNNQYPLQAGNCQPLNVINGIRINPCGLIANTLFNDVISLQEGSIAADGTPLVMLEDGIAWQSDLQYLYNQPDGFNAAPCSDQENLETCCVGDEWSCEEPYLYKDGKYYEYYYPNDNTTQYSYETYPEVINPVDGIVNEHFAVWMRVAALSKFRKLYGWIDQPIAAGTNLTFQINPNFEVLSFKGRKALIVSNNHIFGGKTTLLGPIFYGAGFFCLGMAIFFALKQILRPRRIGDKRYLQYKED